MWRLVRTAVSGGAVVILAACVPAVTPVDPLPAMAPVAPEAMMSFAFPFRGIKYRMTVADAEGGMNGFMGVTADQAIPDEATARIAAVNACGFIGRFPEPKATARRDGGGWAFDGVCH